MISNNLSHACTLLASLSDSEEERDASSPETAITGHRGRRHNYCISIFARGGARARNVIAGLSWPKADDLFQPLFDH